MGDAYQPRTKRHVPRPPQRHESLPLHGSAALPAPQPPPAAREPQSFAARVSARRAAKAAGNSTEAVLRKQKESRRRVVETSRRSSAALQMELAASPDADPDTPRFVSGVSVPDSTFNSALSIDAALPGGGHLQQQEWSLGPGEAGFDHEMPRWSDECVAEMGVHMTSFRSPRQMELQKASQQPEPEPEPEPRPQAAPRAQARSGAPPQAAEAAEAATQRSFTELLPPLVADSLPAPLFLAMSKNEAAASKLRAERVAREHGWRASHDEVELPPEQRVYKYGREEIRVGGRASQVVDETVAQLQKERQNVRLPSAPAASARLAATALTVAYAAQVEARRGAKWEDTLRDKWGEGWETASAQELGAARVVSNGDVPQPSPRELDR